MGWDLARQEARDIPCIMVWPFYEAPEIYRSLSEHGGDEDYIAVIPSGLNIDSYVRWLEAPYFANDVQIVHLNNGDVVYIGAHA